jgi:hypothetical protein
MDFNANFLKRNISPVPILRGQVSLLVKQSLKKIRKIQQKNHESTDDGEKNLKV